MPVIDIVITKEKRSTLTLVAKPGLLIVKAPLQCADQEIANFIASKKSWIEAQCAPREKRHLIFGQPVDWTAPPYAAPNAQTEAEKDKIHRRVCHGILASLFEETLQRLGHRPVPMRVCSMASAWGKCHSSGRVELHWKVATLPKHLAEYVICHELAHLVHFDHTPAFWAQAYRLHPGARRHDRELNQWTIH
jgi:predicted metal-dependent hydrolase